MTFKKSHLCFSLGKAYEDFDDFNNSFKYIKLGNNYKRNTIKYDLKDDLKTFIKLKEFFLKYKFKSNFNVSNNKTAIFIIGLPRSGTSLIEQIISSHSKVYGCGELDYITRIISENFFDKNVLSISKLNNLDQTTVEKLQKKYFSFCRRI